MKVYRIQDKDGRGPFKPGFSHHWVEDREDHDNLKPWYEEFGPVHLKMNFRRLGGSACLTIDQLKRWFTASEYNTLIHHGYAAVEIEAGKIIAQSDIQCFFECHHPLNQKATPFELYELTPHVSPG
jgi:hypothetical protein